MAIALVSGIFAVRLTWHYFAIITGKKPCHHERDEAKLIDVEANQRGPNVVVADCHERHAKRTLDHAVHEKEAKRNGRQNEEVLKIRIAEASRDAANRESRRQ